MDAIAETFCIHHTHVGAKKRRAPENRLLWNLQII